MTTSRLLLQRAWVDGATRDDVLVEIADGRFSRVEPGWSEQAEAQLGDRMGRLEYERSVAKRHFHRTSGESAAPTRLPGLTIPGLANCHSHAFHRALRGRTQGGRGTFWTWREQMYAVAGRLDPDSYLQLATATFQEMVSTGITTVGEFHYLHHQPDGTPYADPHAMSEALVEAARRAGLRIALLDTCYLAAGFGRPAEGVQLRYSDGTATAWAERVADFINRYPDRGADGGHVQVGAAIHSVRAVPADQLAPIVELARGRPLHVHLSEQRAENAECITAHAATPTQQLAEHGVLGHHTTAVHATHLSDDDLALLGATRTTSCFCPTTERDLGDGIGPGRRLRESGSPLSLGSDSHAVIDLFEEMRALETHERLARESRGHWSAAELIATATRHDSLGFPDAGEIAVGRRADLVTLDLATPRTAGTGADEHTVAFAATGADVTQVIADGRVVFTADQLPAIAAGLDSAISALQPTEEHA